MKSSYLIYGAIFAGLTALSGTASAALTGNQTALIDFNTLAVPALYGKTNVLPGPANGGCGGGGGLFNCWSEDGFSVGTAGDGVDFSHLHVENVVPTDIDIYTHQDASGFYIRADDLSAFSAKSFNLKAPIKVENPNAAGFWDVIGFSSAYNSQLSTNYAAYTQIANGFNGTFTLPSAFNNISALWIHWAGSPTIPANGIVFYGNLDDISLAAPVAAVPVPAAVYLFGTGLMGLLAMGKRRRFI